MTVVLAALALAGPIGCGKRGQLEPPAGKPSTNPRSYPAN
jgi:predicted small lipoprotein YifL